jgi:DNA primase catalytic core
VADPARAPALLAVCDADPIAAFRTAVEARELGTAHDPAAVLDWRLHVPGPAGPLPWLPAVPTRRAEDPHWGPYLAALVDHLTACAARVAITAAAMTPATAPRWARPLLDPDHAALRTDLAVWRAGLGVPDGDRRPTGPPRPAAAERRHQRRLDDAVASAGPARNSSVWEMLADGLDAAGLLAAVAAQRPLPDDLPAAALWWRLAPHLAPATVAAGPDAVELRPDWWTALLALLPDRHGRHVLGDRAWPALVAAVTTGVHAGWSPTDLLSAAFAGLPATVTGDETGTGLPEALVFRIAALTDPAPIHEPEPLPADLQPPDDAHELAPVDDETAPITTIATDVPSGDEEAPFDPDYVTPALGAAPRYVTPARFTRTSAIDAEDDVDYLLEQHFWATAIVGRDRLIELNTGAAAFFTDRYPDSWAPRCLRERLGSDLSTDRRFSPGYAPAGWAALVDHLGGLGTTEEELLAAGLAARAHAGALIDRFRDRLAFPIRDADGAVRGFIAGRNPTAADDGHAGPKYLNSPGTDLYRKGEHLLGLFEGRLALAAGARPALVEGPLDAIALTLAQDGHTVGVATLGTALTEHQADLLRSHINAEGPGLLVATDNDPAGHRAAERIFWQLTARGDDPRRLTLPHGLDPADLLHRDGAATLRAAIETAGSLAHQLLDVRIASAVCDRGTVATQKAVREAVEIIVALPPARWVPHIDRVTDALELRPGTVHMAVLDATPTTARPSSTRRIPSRPPGASSCPPSLARVSHPAPAGFCTPVGPTTAREESGAGPPRLYTGGRRRHERPDGAPSRRPTRPAPRPSDKTRAGSSRSRSRPMTCCGNFGNDLGFRGRAWRCVRCRHWTPCGAARPRCPRADWTTHCYAQAPTRWKAPTRCYSESTPCSVPPGPRSWSDRTAPRWKSRRRCSPGFDWSPRRSPAGGQ